MGEIVNLRRMKKAKLRAEQARSAAENRVRFGRTAAEKANDERAAERDARAADGARLDRQPEKE